MNRENSITQVATHIDLHSLVTRLQAAGLETRDLDEWVIEHGQHDASLINNQGLEHQVTFLLDHGETPETILGAFGAHGADNTTRVEALRQCSTALRTLSEHPDFSGGAAEFEPGGIGHKALQIADIVLREAVAHEQ